MAGTKTPIERPRARTVNGQEVEIESLELARNHYLLYETALARMLHGLSSRNYSYGSENPGSNAIVKKNVIHSLGKN